MPMSFPRSGEPGGGRRDMGVRPPDPRVRATPPTAPRKAEPPVSRWLAGSGKEHSAPEWQLGAEHALDA